MECTMGTILIVDDNPTNLSVLFDCLNESGFQTLVALNGNDALSRADYAKPDLILLDVMMPGMDGFETCRKLKQNQETSSIPVIFMTALSDTSDKVEGFKCGAVDYICKPFQQEEVLARINAHLTIQHQKRELARLNATKDKFFSIISHDVRNQFNLLVGYSELLDGYYDEYSEDERKEYIQDIAKASVRTHKLFENLVYWAKMQRGGMQMNPENLNLKLLVDQAVASLEPDAKHKEIHLVKKIDENCTINADKNMAQLIIRNLVSNAIKFTHKSGQVTICASTDHDYIKISVSDTGVGMKQERVDTLFRLDIHQSSIGTYEEKGTGLGLILCHDFINQHKGKIWVESEIDKGTTFIFTLPKVPKCN